MKLSIVIPSYNNGEKVIEILRRLDKVVIPKTAKEIIVVNDGSVDPAYKKLKKEKNIIYLEHKNNLGKGGALRTGFKNATGDIFFIQDDDLEYDPLAIPQLITPIIQRKTKVVFGSRRLNKNNNYSSLSYFWGGVLINTIIGLILRRNLTDSITGSKAFLREVYEKIKPMETNGFEIESEITAKIVKQGYNILEIPISYNPRTHKQGKNIRWHHAFKIITTLLKYSN